MAEQEACAELVEKASQDQTTGKIEGESLLLPLLQGLLQAPEKDQTADSGTESGEDQRNGLIAEVQRALDKLSQSLFNDSTDISEERRSSLLCLVTKLQAGLSTTVPKVERRLSSETGRFSKRKNRQNRHTVGVSSEELADARRLMEEISGHKITPSTSQKDSINIQKRNSESYVSVNTDEILSKKESDEPNNLSKQNSDSSVTSNRSINKYKNKSSVKNTTPKPFSSSNNSSTVQTPDLSEHLDAFFEDEIPKMSSQDKHLDTLVNKSHQSTGMLTSGINGSETEDDTIKITEIVEEPNLSVNPIYSKPENSYNQFDSKHMDRFNTQIKKQRMKRANTIDIPKPLQFYEDSDCSDGETEEQKHKNNYYALRGPIRVGDPVNKRIVPTFQPKTASDQKFLAFLNKNTDNSDDKNKNSIWTDHKNRAPVWGSKFGNIKNNFESSARPQTNNVKNFWKTQDDALTARSNQYGPKISRQSARNLQQMFEDKQREKDVTPERLKPLKDITEEQNALTGKLTIKTEPEKNYRFLPGPLPVNQFSHAPQSAFKPIPQKSHTFQPIIQEPRNENVVMPESPQELLKTEIKDHNKSLFLYSPKPLTSSQGTSPALSPVTTKPWLTPSPDGGSRVLNMAAKKFEIQSQNESPVIKPRKLSKEITSTFVPKQQPTEKHLASYITKPSDVKNSTVRKLSDQYDTIRIKTPEYTSHTSVVYQPTTPLKIPEAYSGKVTTNDYSKPKVTPTSPREPKPTPWWHQAYKDKVSGKRPSYNQSKSFDNDKKLEQFQPQNNNYNATTAVYNTQGIYQHVPGKESNPTSPENVYTSTLTFSPAGKPKNQQLEAVSHPPKLETQLSNESIHEYTAISSKVMGGAQQAVTVKQGPMTRNEHDMSAIFNLKNTLSNLGKPADDRLQPKSNSVSPIKPISSPEVTHKTSVPDPIRKFSPQNTVSSQGGYYKAPEPQKTDYNVPQRSLQRSPQRLSSRSFGSTDIKPHGNDPKLGVVKPMQKTMAPVYNNVARIQTAAAQSQQTVEFNEKGQGVITSKFHIPVVSVEPGSPLPTSPGGRALSKSDSWHQICLASNQTANKPSPGKNVVKSKSSHNLAVPQRQFEAGMSKDELLQKRKAMESYLLGGNKSPQTVKSEKVVKTSINRIKTSEKQSAYKSSGIARSRTLPDIVCPPVLDESNVDQAFEDLFKSSCI